MPLSDLDRRQLEILREQDTEIGAFLNELENILKQAGCYTKPLPGDLRFDAIRNGVRALASRARA